MEHTMKPEQTPANGANGTEKTVTLYTSLAEAKENPPEVDPEARSQPRIFAVSHNGTSRYVWSATAYMATLAVVKADGYTAAVAEKQGREVTPEAAAAVLAGLTDEQLKALGLNRRKGK